MIQIFDELSESTEGLCNDIQRLLDAADDDSQFTERLLTGDLSERFATAKKMIEAAGEALGPIFNALAKEA